MNKRRSIFTNLFKKVTASSKQQTFKILITTISFLLLIAIGITAFSFSNSDNNNKVTDTTATRANDSQSILMSSHITATSTNATSQSYTIANIENTRSPLPTTAKVPPTNSPSKIVSGEESSTPTSTTTKKLTASTQITVIAQTTIPTMQTTIKAPTTVLNTTLPNNKNKNTEIKNDECTNKLTNLSEYKYTGKAISKLTPPESLKLDDNELPVDYEYCFEGKATAYTGDPATASGRVPMPGHIAVDPSKIPYGTELYVVSADGAYVYGYCIAADTGGFVAMGNADIDLYMDNETMCYDWGNRPVKIYVL